MTETKYDKVQLADYFLQRLLDRAREATGPVHADLSGTVLDNEGYRRRLKEDEQFAKQQVDIAIASWPVEGSVPEGLLARERRVIAVQIKRFAEKHPRLPQEQILPEFLRNRPLLKLSSEDLEKIVRMLKIEQRLDLPMPSVGELPDSSEVPSFID